MHGSFEEREDCAITASGNVLAHNTRLTLGFEEVLKQG